MNSVLGDFVRGIEVCRTSELLKKVLIVAVRSFRCDALIRGLENLGAPCKGVRVVTFCVVQKVTQKAHGAKPCDPRFKALPKVILQKFSAASAETGFACKTAAKRL